MGRSEKEEAWNKRFGLFKRGEEEVARGMKERGEVRVEKRKRSRR